MTAGRCRSTRCGSVAPRPRFARLRQRSRGCACSDHRRRTRRARPDCIAHGLGSGPGGAQGCTRTSDRRGPAGARAGASQPAVRPRARTRGREDAVRIAARTQHRRQASRALAGSHRGRRREQPGRLGRREVRGTALRPHASRAGRGSFHTHADRTAKRRFAGSASASGGPALPPPQELSRSPTSSTAPPTALPTAAASSRSPQRSRICRRAGAEGTGSRSTARSRRATSVAPCPRAACTRAIPTCDT
jgi:hypothetical protein